MPSKSQSYVNMEQSNTGTATEYVSRPVRRKFSNEYKRRIVKEAEACTEHGEIGALLRREGLYSSHLTDWRRQEAKGELGGAKNKKRGRKSAPKVSPAERRLAELERENSQLRQQLEQAEYIISAQKKLSLALEQTLSGQKDAN